MKSEKQCETLNKVLDENIKIIDTMNNQNFKGKAENLINEFVAFKNSLKVKELNLIELLIDFCYEKNIEPEEMGDILSEHKEFINIIKKNAKKYNYVKKDKTENSFEEEW